MDIITGRLLKGGDSHTFFTSGATLGYNGQSGVTPATLDPIPINGDANKRFTSLYMFDGDYSMVPFDVFYSINPTWIVGNKLHVFDYSYSNDRGFQAFIDSNGFQKMVKDRSIKKEKNLLLTDLVIPFEEVYKMFIFSKVIGSKSLDRYITKSLDLLDRNELMGGTKVIGVEYKLKEPRSI